jgi:hypothetical protein
VAAVRARIPGLRRRLGFALLADDGLDGWRRAAAEVGETLGAGVTVQPVDPGALPSPADWREATGPPAEAEAGWTGVALIRTRAGWPI